MLGRVAAALNRIPRWWLLAGFLTAAIAGGVPLVWLTLTFLGMPARTAAGFAVAIGAVFAAGSVLFARMHWSGWLPSGAARVGVSMVWAFLPALTAVALVLATVDVPPVLAVVLGVGAVPVGLFWYGRMVDRQTPLQMRRPAAVRSLAEAHALVDACRSQLRDAAMSRALRAVVEVNLASGLVQRSAMIGTREGMDEAAAILTRVVGEPEVDPWILVFAVRQLVTGQDVLASRHGVSDGYAEAIRLQRDVVRRLPPEAPQTAEVVAAAYRDQATYHGFRAGELLRGQNPRAARERDMALAALDEGLRLARPGSALCTDLKVMKGATTATSGEDADRDDGIQQIRLALRGAGRTNRDLARLCLALLLLDRAELAGPTASSDLVEAEAHARKVVTGRSDARGQGSRLLARAAALRQHRGRT